MFIKNLEVKNFKCFDNEIQSLDFSIPDGKTVGSGLNIFIGENNTGKSTIFEAIDFLRDGTKKELKEIKNKKASDNDEISIQIVFTENIREVVNNFSQENKKQVFEKYIYEDNNKEYFKLLRSSKDIKSLQLWNNQNSNFKNEAGIDAPLKKLFENNFVWSDTNPNNEVSFGATTICGNLLKVIARSFAETDDYRSFSNQFNKTFNSEESGLRKELKNIEEKTQTIFSEQFGDAQISFHFNELKIDSFFKNTKIEVDDGILTYMEETGSGMQRSIALALLQVYADELVKHPENNNILKPFFLFIDEPEICLHPRAQKKLLDSILKLSKTKQIFIATHSPYFLKNSDIKNSGVLFFEKNDTSKITLKNIRDKDWGIFPWSPSWGEISYYAYNLSTTEFHNELYGYLQDLSEKNLIKEFDNFLKNKKNITENKNYWNERDEESEITLCSYIRNQIHHPENGNNEKYKPEELDQSIKLLIGAIKNTPKQETKEG